MKVRTALLALLILLAGCQRLPPIPGLVPASPTPTVTATSTSSPTPVPPTHTPTAAPTETPTANPVPVDVLTAELKNILTAGLAPTATPDGTGYQSSGGIESVEVIPLETAVGDPPLWLAYSQGTRSFEPLQNHFVALYTHLSDGWTESGRVELEGPDYLQAGGVQQVVIAPGELWITSEGGAGAHASCFDLLRFDGSRLRSMLSNCHSSAPAGEVRDINGDGTPEVLLNGSDDYVFCYACGVRVASFQAWRWQDGELAEVIPQHLSTSAPQELRTLNDRAVDLAGSELWKAAQETMAQAVQMAPENATVAWNAAYIDMIAGRRQALAAPDGPYPLLSLVFYGDYAAALDLLRPYSPSQVFDPAGPLVTGTPAQDWLPELKTSTARFAGKALEVEPTLAWAFFLRGWAAYLASPGDEQARLDILQAASLAPQDEFIARCAEYVQ